MTVKPRRPPPPAVSGEGLAITSHDVHKDIPLITTSYTHAELINRALRLVPNALASNTNASSVGESLAGTSPIAGADVKSSEMIAKHQITVKSSPELARIIRSYFNPLPNTSRRPVIRINSPQK